MAERLRIVADNLSRVYVPAPLQETDDLRALIDHLRANSRRPPLQVDQLCAGVSPDDERERLIICPQCGQMFDCRDRAQVEHHGVKEHAPKYVIRPC